MSIVRPDEREKVQISNGRLKEKMSMMDTKRPSSSIDDERRNIFMCFSPISMNETYQLSQKFLLHVDSIKKGIIRKNTKKLNIMI